MKRKHRDASQKITIHQQINRLLLIISVTMAVIVAGLFMMLVSVNRLYGNALLCANIAADFNKEFKSSLDLEMYNHVISPRSENSVHELPLAELDAAEEVFRRLEETTALPDNRWRAQSMLDMCGNLRMYMQQIAQTQSYDRRMELLERNIRGETGLTALIESYMHDFIDDEVQELARLRNLLSRQTNWLIAATAAALLICAILIALYSLKVTRRITEPIRELSVKAENFGADNFFKAPVNTDITEFQTLNQNFDLMADRITALMEKQMEDQQSLHRAQLEILKAQINPHFLYNTLDSIAILAESERDEDVVNMVNSLSTFFRNSLSNGKDIIPLRAELAQAESYLEIQQVRYSDILVYHITVPEELLDYMVPKLILQPLIENALYHGIKNRRRKGTITIWADRDDEGLKILVRDDGAGMSAEQSALLNKGDYSGLEHGLGIKNVTGRIELYCGKPYGLFFDSIQGTGTTVTVLLPKNGITENTV